MEKPIWEWSLEQIRTVTDRARAGRDLTPSSWPNGARVAVALSFDFDAETGWLRRNQHSPAAMARGGYDARVGISRILDLFDKYDLPSSFFIPRPLPPHSNMCDLARSATRARHRSLMSQSGRLVPARPPAVLSGEAP